MPKVRKTDWLEEVEDVSDMDYYDNSFDPCMEDHEIWLSWLVQQGFVVTDGSDDTVN